ncbi:signal peptidase 22 kDa subunit [Aaosphaeria arxii CBS 175.79]|uniref:Signal peptidase subunit 3 n=1 Tax=Aaosphaeria arxii CBS 175.79 TaxID=1450172 RepID=A0A6A5Y755_9PLEO|nr:signal peptidase 22 kDa subunit [Aaosphaeria arxii CBS 175.79]KAF2021392.1 signal peptidase 22 kDa subunit [Aaosphaeria arxii CBS 175.79]
MHSTLVRVQNVFGFFTTVAFTVATVIALSTFIHPQNPSASVQLRNVQVQRGRPHYYSYKKEEYAHIKFDLDTDLSSLFNWNTKQVFLYLKAVYPSTKAGEPASEAIVWDAVLASAAQAWHTVHYVHPNPKKTKSSKSAKDKSKKTAESPYPRGEIHLKNQRPKYQITDVSGKLQNRTDVVLELGWNVQPWVGALVWTNKVDLGMWLGLKGGVSKPFDFPEIGKKSGDTQTEKGKEGHRLEVGGEHPVRRGSK